MLPAFIALSILADSSGMTRVVLAIFYWHKKQLRAPPSVDQSQKEPNMANGGDFLSIQKNHKRETITQLRSQMQTTATYSAKACCKGEKYSQTYEDKLFE